MSDTNIGPELSSAEGIDEWTARFRKVQKVGAEFAVAAGIELDDIPQIIRDERHNAKPEDLEEASNLVANAFARRQAGK